MPITNGLGVAVGAAVGGLVGAAAGAVGGAVTGAAGHVVSGVAGIGISAVFSGAGQWVATGAAWLLGQVGGAMSSSTTVDLSSSWFSAHESVMAAMAAALVLPMVCCATIQAIYRQSASMLVRTFLVQLPLALLLTGVAVELVQMALAITDTLSAQVLGTAGLKNTDILAPVSSFLVGAGAGSQVPAFVVFVGGLLVALAALTLWLELVIRAAAVSVAVLFLPLALAALVWPAIAHWCRRLADTLAALVLSKLVIASVLALAVSAVAGGLGGGPTGTDGGGFAAVVTGIALLVIATLSPFTLLRLIPAVEAGAVSHLESTRHRLTSAAMTSRDTGNTALDWAKKAGSGGGVAALSAGADRPQGASASMNQHTGTLGLSPETNAAFRKTGFDRSGRSVHGGSVAVADVAGAGHDDGDRGATGATGGNGNAGTPGDAGG